MHTYRRHARALFCVLTVGCTYRVQVAEQVQPGGSSAEPTIAQGSAIGVTTAMAPTEAMVAQGNNPGAPPSMLPKADGGTASPFSPKNPNAGAPAPPVAAEDECSKRVVSRSKPCSDDPDPCGLNSGFEGDEYCLKPPPEGDGIQIHFGPKDYNDLSNEYVIQPGTEFNNSMLARIPLTETRSWNRLTVHLRPTAVRWTSMTAPADAREGFYPQNDTGCGTGRTFDGRGFGGNRNLIYDNPPQGIPAPENAGIGDTIEGNASSCVGLHSYNFSDKPQLREMWVNLYFADPAEITQTTGSVAMVGGVGLRLPPGQSQEVSHAGKAIGDGRIIQLSSERNVWTPRLMAWLNDELIYDSHDWRAAVTFNYDSITTNPPIDGVHDGAKSGILPFSDGDTLRYTCFVNNGSDVTLTFQNEIKTAEMCNLWGTTIGGGIR